MVQTHPCLDCARHAERDARRAIALDPKLADGHLLLAASLGAEGRSQGMLVARANDYPDQAKAQIDAALAADPGNCFAIAGEGGWNIEVVRAGGETLARWIYGAKLDTGMADFAKAIACAPDNPALRYQYALALSRLRFGALSRPDRGCAHARHDRQAGDGVRDIPARPRARIARRAESGRSGQLCPLGAARPGLSLITATPTPRGA